MTDVSVRVSPNDEQNLVSSLRSIIDVCPVTSFDTLCTILLILFVHVPSLHFPKPTSPSLCPEIQIRLKPLYPDLYFMSRSIIEWRLDLTLVYFLDFYKHNCSSHGLEASHNKLSKSASVISCLWTSANTVRLYSSRTVFCQKRSRVYLHAEKSIVSSHLWMCTWKKTCGLTLFACTNTCVCVCVGVRVCQRERAGSS